MRRPTLASSYFRVVCLCTVFVIFIKPSPLSWSNGWLVERDTWFPGWHQKESCTNFDGGFGITSISITCMYILCRWLLDTFLREGIVHTMLAVFPERQLTVVCWIPSYPKWRQTPRSVQIEYDLICIGDGRTLVGHFVGRLCFSRFLWRIPQKLWWHAMKTEVMSRHRWNIWTCRRVIEQWGTEAFFELIWLGGLDILKEIRSHFWINLLRKFRPCPWHFYQDISAIRMRVPTIEQILTLQHFHLKGLDQVERWNRWNVPFSSMFFVARSSCSFENRLLGPAAARKSSDLSGCKKLWLPVTFSRFQLFWASERRLLQMEALKELWRSPRTSSKFGA